MAILGFFLEAIGTILGGLIWFFIWVFVAHAILSWVSPDPRNFIVQMINSLCEPILARVRAKLPPFGMLDLSVMVVIFGLYFLDMFLVRSIMYYAAQAQLSVPTVVGG